MPLNNFQAQFKNLMLDHPDALKTPSPDFSNHFEEGSIPLQKRLSVYRNNIVGSLTDIMSTTFPMIYKLVGKDFFESLARSFILENPPAHGCLNHYGAGFDAFIENFTPAQSLPYLADVARLEIAMNDSYYALEETPLRAEDLTAVPQEKLDELPLALCEHAKLIQSDYPLLEIKKLCENPDSDTQPDMCRGIKLMVARPENSVELTVLEDDEYYMLTRLREQKKLGEAVLLTLEAYPAFNFQRFLQKHFQLETFSVLQANEYA